MPRLFVVTYSPWEEDSGLPWEYEEDNFVAWFDEVFREGYKRDNPPISADECVCELASLGYQVDVKSL